MNRRMKYATALLMISSVANGCSKVNKLESQVNYQRKEIRTLKRSLEISIEHREFMDGHLRKQLAEGHRQLAEHREYNHSLTNALVKSGHLPINWTLSQYRTLLEALSPHEDLGKYLVNNYGMVWALIEGSRPKNRLVPKDGTPSINESILEALTKLRDLTQKNRSPPKSKKPNNIPKRMPKRLNL